MLWPARKTRYGLLGRLDSACVSEASDFRMLTLNVGIKGNMNSNLIRCAV